jgi:hypothetical protein
MGDTADNVDRPILHESVSDSDARPPVTDSCRASSSQEWIRQLIELATAERESTTRSTAEIIHHVRHGCQHCAHYDLSTCAFIQEETGELSQPAFARLLVDPAGSCPIGRFPNPELPAITRLNLIYFIFPKRHPLNVWQWNVAELLKRIRHFNGRRLISIATAGSETNAGEIDPPEAVMEAFAGHDVEFRFAPNDAVRGEAPHFLPALREIASTNSCEAFFYAHAKGVSRGNQRAIRPWTSELYHHNLDRIDEVRDFLRRWPCVGAAKSYGYHPALLKGKSEPTWLEHGRAWHGWHYAGAFWWARHDALFSRPDWDQFEIYTYATEKYPANFFTSEEALCLAYDDCQFPYDPLVWHDFGGMMNAA